MKTLFSKRNILFLALASTLFFSCRKNDDDETFNGRPENIIDKEHVVLNDMYGITAIFPIDQWTNTYLDTMPTNPSSYFDGFRYNAICASLLSDNQQEEGGTPLYATTIYFMRFHEKLDNKEAADEYINTFKKKMYNDFIGYCYTEIIDKADTTLGKGNYTATHYIARRGIEFKEGMEDIYLIYKSPRLYGILIKIDDDMRESSLSKCMDILPTVSIK
ncbi:MAG: hypothetical protein K6F48_01315 [Paludibacteraceae bacterium]|nr:hypothetical protein [Paludibacteraceae bacterium]